MENKAKELGDLLWKVACRQLRGKMGANSFQDYMLSFLFLYYISNNYLKYIKKELANDYIKCEEECKIINDKNNHKLFSQTQEEYKEKIKEFVEKDLKEYTKNNPYMTKQDVNDERDDRIKKLNEQINDSIITPLTLWYLKNLEDVEYFEEIVRKKIHYVIKPQYLWDNIYEMAKYENEHLLEILQHGFNFIENKSFNITFKGLFSEVNLSSEKLGKDNTQRNLRVCNIIKEIGDGLLQFNVDSIKENDILGDAYEYLISQFASNSGAKAGEFYTPQEVSSILSEIVTLDSQNPKLQKQTDINGMLDFACGSGSLLINVKKHVDKINQENNSHIKITRIYGQENNVTTYNLARMNMILHGIKDSEFIIFHGDTLANEWSIFSEKNPSKKIECDIVVANPPFSLNWEHTSSTKDDFRFAGYGVAPRSTADFAFLLHGFHFLKSSGTMAIILPHGVLFRGGEEENIRKKLIDDDNIDAIIGLPSNLFFSTGIPVCIIVLKKCRKEEDILFINADKYFRKDKNRNKLDEVHIKKIVDTYKERKEESNYSKRVTKKSIIENDYNLNISRYVSTAIEDKIVDLEQVKKALDSNEANIINTKSKVNDFLKELGLPELK